MQTCNTSPKLCWNGEQFPKWRINGPQVGKIKNNTLTQFHQHNMSDGCGSRAIYIFSPCENLCKCRRHRARVLCPPFFRLSAPYKKSVSCSPHFSRTMVVAIPQNPTDPKKAAKPIPLLEDFFFAQTNPIAINEMGTRQKQKTFTHGSLFPINRKPPRSRPDFASLLPCVQRPCSKYSWNCRAIFLSVCVDCSVDTLTDFELLSISMNFFNQSITEVILVRGSSIAEGPQKMHNSMPN